LLASPQYKNVVAGYIPAIAWNPILAPIRTALYYTSMWNDILSLNSLCDSAPLAV